MTMLKQALHCTFGLNADLGIVSMRIRVYGAKDVVPDAGRRRVKAGITVGRAHIKRAPTVDG